MKQKMLSVFSKIFIKDDKKIFASAFLISFLIFSVFYVDFVFGEAVTLSVTVSAGSITFTSSTNQFPNLTASSPVMATTTLSVTTNNTAGWNVTLYGDAKTNSVTAMHKGGVITNSAITDATQWSVGAAIATTTGGNAAAITSGDDVLAFRVMSASSTNGGAFLSTSWWGTSDVNFNAQQKWAGIASTTGASRIGNAGTGSYSATVHVNTVQYYLDVPASQESGDYSGGLTYTASAN